MARQRDSSRGETRDDAAVARFPQELSYGRRRTLIKLATFDFIRALPSSYLTPLLGILIALRVQYCFKFMVKSVIWFRYINGCGRG